MATAQDARESHMSRGVKVGAALAALLAVVAISFGVAHGTAYAIQSFVTQHQRFRRDLEESLDWPLRPPQLGRQSPFLFACQSQHCRREGQHLRRNVAWGLKPCDDFYEYACSGDDSQSTSLATEAQEHFLEEVAAVLYKWGKLRWLQRTHLTSKALKFYHACLSAPDDVPSMKRQLEGFLSSLNQRIPEVWAAEMTRALHIFPVVHVTVAPSPRSNERKCVVLRKPDSLDIDVALGAPKVSSKKFEDSLRNLVGVAASQQVIRIAWNLRSFSGPHSEAQSPLEEYDETDVKDLMETNPGWKWDQYLAALLLDFMEVDENTCVIVRSPEYMSHLKQTMETFKSAQMKEYFRYAATLHLLPFFRLGKGERKAMEHICSLVTYRLYNYAFLRHFRDTEHFGILSKAGMKEALVRNSYRYVLSKSTRIPQRLGTQITDELALANKTYFNPMADVDDYYDPVPPTADRKAMLTSYVNAKRALSLKWLHFVVGSAGKVFDTNLDLSCRYDPDTKALGIPLSIAHMDVEGKEFFLESSTVGLLMTRSIYEAFQEKYMMSPELNKYRACYEAQYASLNVTVNGVVASVDGSRTLRFNMLDNIAVQVLHHAYRSSVSFYSAPKKEHPYRHVLLHLVDLPNVSSEQIFYLMYAQSFCDGQENVDKVLSNASWSPARVRVNLPLLNYPPFAEAFGCPVGSPMNPAEKCIAA